MSVKLTTISILAYHAVQLVTDWGDDVGLLPSSPGGMTPGGHPGGHAGSGGRDEATPHPPHGALRTPGGPKKG